MQSKRETLLCHYFYDPLNRLTACTPSKEASTQRFYLKDRLATEVQGAVQRSIVQVDDQLLAQQTRQNGKAETAMLATDQHRSVLNALAAARPNPLAYTPYGHRPLENGLLSLLGFNGERPDPVTGCYLLGNGYRAFNPVLMRFNNPDSWSPFGEGGLNAYAYCVGDPVNRVDPTGHFGNPLKGFLNLIGLRTPSSRMARANQAYEIATAIPTVQTSQMGRTSTPANSPRELPPPYDFHSIQSPTPPGHGAPTFFTQRNAIGPLTDTPPPIYPGNQPKVLSAEQQKKLHYKIDQSTAHLRRVEDTTQHLESPSSAIRQTISELTNEIDSYRSTLGQPPTYSRHQQIRESL
jgi:RHS repeat-associated protein